MIEKNNITVNKIEIKSANRSNVDIKTWRNATKSADNGKRTSLYDLYEDLMLDNILADAIDKRITAITNAEITFTRADGEAVPEIDTLIDTPEFEEIIREIMLAKFWGVTLLEFEFLPDRLIVHSIPRKHIRADRHEVAINQNDEGGIPYDEDFFLEVGHKNDLGLILRAAPFVIYKRNNFGDWAQYVEIFGRPIRTAYYDMYDEGARAAILRAFEDAGAILSTVMPNGTKLEILPGASSGDGSIYNNLRGACNEEILVGMLGQTMTTLDGASRSQGEVHMTVQQDKHKSDRRFVQRELNKKLLPMLAKRGYPVEGGYFYFPEQGQTLTLTERIAIDAQVAQLVPMAAQHIYDTYGVARPEAGDDLVEVRIAQPVFDPTIVPLNGGGDPENSLSLKERIVSFFVSAPQDGASISTNRTETIGSKIATLVCSANADEKLIGRVAKGDADYFDAELFGSISGKLIDAFTAGWVGKTITNEIGVDYGVQNSAVVTANETNLYHFSAAKTLAEIQKLNQLYRESKSFEEYYKNAIALCEKYNKAWARTEYETARLTGESSANYQRLKSKTDLFPYWEYRTVGDDQVRPAHAALDGVILPANDPRWSKIYPPNGWGCRCRTVPRMKAETTGVNMQAMRQNVDKYFKTSDWAIAQAQGFDINRGELQQVFPANQMYIRKFPNNAAKYLDKLNFKNYGLDPYTKCVARATEPTPKYDGTADEWFANRQKGGVVTLNDMHRRSVVITPTTFKSHTSAKHASRVAYLQSLPGVLNDPDEIWLNAEYGKKSYDNYTLIKYYSDEIIVINCQITKNVNTIKSWYPLAKKADVISSVRRGLLIYKKASQ